MSDVMSPDSVSITAVLIDPGLPEGLEPILKDLPIPLLPFGTKPLIAHWLERIAEMGVRRVRLLLSHLPERTRQFVGDGSRWGLDVSYAATRANQEPGALWALISDIPADHLVVASLGAWPRRSLLNWFRDILSTGALRFNLGASHWLSDLGNAAEFGWQGEWAQPSDDHLLVVQDLKAYWRLNMDLVSAVEPDPLPYGFEAEPGVWIGSNCKLDRGCQVIGPAVLGESSIVAGRTLLGPNAVVGDHVVVEEGVNINNSVVFPRSFIGSHIVVSEAIVAGDVIYNVTSGVLLYINDPAIAARRERITQRVTPGQRLIALGLMVLLAPFWLLAAVLLKLLGRQAFVAEARYLEDGLGLGGERMFTGVTLTSLNVSHPLWRQSPWLGQVFAGRVALVGTSLRKANDIVYPEWVTESELFEPGVVTLASVTGVPGDDLEATIVADAYQLAREERGVNFRLLGRWLLGLLRRR